MCLSVFANACTKHSAKTSLENDLKTVLKSSDTLILDVRTPEEFGVKHAFGAVNIPVNELENKLSKELPDLDKTIVVHCAKGGRSGKAMAILSDHGYTNLHDAKTLENVLTNQ